MTPTKRGKKPAEVREMPAPTNEFTPESPETPVPKAAEAAPRGLPAPKKFDMPPEDLFRYYAENDRDFPGRLTLYGYRKLPVTDVTLPLSEEELRQVQQKKKDPPSKNICILKSCPVEDPANWNRWVCESFGAGDYHFKLNDQHPSVKKTIAMTTTKGEGSLRDWNSFPPLLHHNEVGELDEVVLNDPLNESYLRWARLNGIRFPGDAGTPQETRTGEDTEMAATVVESVMRQNEKLNNKVLEMAEKQQDRAPAPAPVDATARGQMGAVETVVEGAKQAMGVMGSAMKQMMDNQVSASNPKEQLQQAIEIARIIAPAPAASSGNDAVVKMLELQLTAQREQAKQALDQQEKSFTRLIEMQEKSHQATMKMMESRLDSLEKLKTGTGEQAASTDEAVLDKYVRIKRKFRELDEEDGGGQQSEGPAWLGPLVGLGEKLIQGVSETTRNIAAMRSAQAPGPVIQDVTPDPNPAPAPQPVKDQQMDMRVQYAKQIHKDLVDAIKSGARGYDFAAAIITHAGQPAYDMAAGQGYNGLVGILQSHPPLWNELILPPIGAAALEKFLAEFLDRDKVMESMQVAKGQPPRRGPVVNQ